MRGRRRDDEKVRAIRERNMTRTPVLFFVKETYGDRILRERLERERRDEFRRVGRHHDKHFVRLFHEKTRQLSRFVGGDRTGYAEDDGLVFCGRGCAHGTS